MDLHDLRINYESDTLTEENCPGDPMVLFHSWINQALKDTGFLEANGMVLGTVNPQTMQPSGRVVLLKEFDNDGFTFFTNYESRKAQELEMNPKCSLTFWWGERSCRIEGTAHKVSREKSIQYFLSRPTTSQLGAWSSDQSKIIESEKTLLNNFEAKKKEFESKPMECPDFWGGYTVVPSAIEFWQGRPSRLHDRIRYEDRPVWKFVRLSP